MKNHGNRNRIYISQRINIYIWKTIYFKCHP